MMTLRLLTAASAAVAGLLLATIPDAEAKGHGARMSAGAGMKTGVVRSSQPPIVRDHRKGEVWARRCKNRECPYYPPR